MSKESGLTPLELKLDELSDTLRRTSSSLKRIGILKMFLNDNLRENIICSQHNKHIDLEVKYGNCVICGKKINDE